METHGRTAKYWAGWSLFLKVVVFDMRNEADPALLMKFCYSET
jgi:hypothetical protein